MTVDRVGIVGAGLIGTSIGLALARRGQECVLVDADGEHVATAAALGAGRPGGWSELEGCDHVVIAVPPPAVTPVLTRLEGLDLKATLSDTASTKANVAAEVETMTPVMSTHFCGGHPIAGRERGGPAAAQPQLFDGAVWAICPLDSTSDQARADAADLARRCGARPVEIDPREHDDVMAAVSHVPQLVASALAARLGEAGEVAPAFAGQGFRDTTRLADSDPDLWAAIAAANATPVARELRQLAEALDVAAVALEAGDGAAAVRTLVANGRDARALLPGKAARARRTWARVGVVLADQPGELARLLTTAGHAGINVEDLSIEHAPDHPRGYVDVDVRPEDADRLVAALVAEGLSAHRSA